MGGDDTGADSSGPVDRSLRRAHPTERAVGIEHYVSDVDGIGGRLRRSPEDFRVRELERVEPEPLDSDPGAYAHVVLRATLRGWDTNDFASTLSNRLGISRERVSWAGTKDKRAVSTQLFSVQGIDPADVPGAAAPNGEEEEVDDGIGDAELDVLGRFGRAIELGDLAGNEFRVVASDADAPERASAITDAIMAFAADGQPPDDGRGALEDGTTDGPVEVAVPNYFGQQRFGSRRPITHEVGLAIVRRDWRDAVRTYVAEPYESEPESTQRGRETAGDCMADGDWTSALDALPNRLGYERSLVHALQERAGDGSSGGNGSPGGHGSPGGDGSPGADGSPDAEDYRAALDALPWNLQRLFVHAAQSYAFNRIVSERLAAGLPVARPVEGDVVCFAETGAPASSDSAVAADLVVPDTDRLQRVTADRVDSVTRHCERGRAFVTAPLVGTETDLGDGEPGEIERRVLDDLDLSPEQFDLPEPFDSTGTRRAVLVRTALEVDLDAGDPAFSFALPKGSYATVLLREYLKCDPVALG